jgi:hypothetical protein
MARPLTERSHHLSGDAGPLDFHDDFAANPDSPLRIAIFIFWSSWTKVF